jgi:HemY protein
MAARFGGAMRSVFWLLGLAALAVALALLVGHNEATLTLFWPPYRFDVSFNFVVFCLIGGFVLLYAALRAFSMLRDLPAQAQRWRSQQIERAVVGSVMDALSHQLAGRFVRAQSAAQQAVDQLKGVPAGQWPRRDQLQLLAHLLLAESAQSLQNRERRDENLQAALSPKLAKSAPEAHEGALLRAVRWAVEDHDADAARARLAELPQGASRRIQALRLKLRIARLGGETGEALETARVLAKHRAFSPEASRSIVRGLALDALREAHDMAQLDAFWNGLDATERAMPEVALPGRRAPRQPIDRPRHQRAGPRAGPRPRARLARTPVARVRDAGRGAAAPARAGAGTRPG